MHFYLKQLLVAYCLTESGLAFHWIISVPKKELKLFTLGILQHKSLDLVL